MARSSLPPDEWLNTKPNFMRTLFGTGEQSLVQMVKVFDHDGRHAHMGGFQNSKSQRGNGVLFTSFEGH